MDSNPPTTADYAWDAARTAKARSNAASSENTALRERVQRLERDVHRLTDALNALIDFSQLTRDTPELAALEDIGTDVLSPGQRAMRRQIQDQRNQRNGA